MAHYRQELGKYEKRIRKARGKAVKDAAQECLDALRRALEQADGLDETFAKYMDDPHGKYIVFCSDKRHMDEMMGHMEWFAKVDAHPRIYSFYSSDPGADESFRAFKADTDTGHLRLIVH